MSGMEQGIWEQVAAIFVHNNPDVFEIDLLNINQAVELAKALEGMGYIVERKPYSTLLHATKDTEIAPATNGRPAKL